MTLTIAPSRLFLTALSALTLLCVSSFAAWGQRTAEEQEEYRLYVEGERRYKSGRFRMAIDAYDRAARLAPGKYQYHFKIGNCYTKLREPASAILAYKRAVKIEPEHLQSLVRIGYLSEQLKRTDEAVKYYDLACKQTPDSSERLELKTKIIDLLYAENRIDEAEPHIEDARALDPQSMSVLYYALHHYNLKEDYRQTVATAQTSLKRLSGMSASHGAKYFYEIGYAYYRLGQYQRARQFFSRANHGVFVKLIEKTTAQYHYELAEGYAAIYEYAQAERYLEQALKIEPGYPKALKLRQAVATERRGDAAAMQRLQTAADEAKADPQRAVFLRQICERQLQTGQHAQALQTAEQCLQIQRYDYISSYFKAVALYKLGDLPEAKRIMEMLVNYSGIDTALRSKYNFFLGIIYEKQQDYRNAISVYRMATYGSYQKAAEDQLMILVKRRELQR